jgi:ribonuclease HI
MEMEYAIKMNFKATDNEAEYEAVIVGHDHRELKVEAVEVRSDSFMIVGQVSGEFDAKEERIKEYQAKVWELEDHFREFSIKQVLRDQNVRADQLARLAQDPREIQKIRKHQWKF